MDEAVTKQQALEPCPFCGGEAEIIRCSVHCNNPCCEAQPFTAGQSEAEAISAWNRRAQPPAPRAEAVEAKDAQRYRWLRNRFGPHPINVSDGNNPLYESNLDVAVDAAIAHGADEGESNA